MWPLHKYFSPLNMCNGLKLPYIYVSCAYHYFSAPGISCRACVTPRICVTTTGTYLLRVSRLFDPYYSPCDLLLNSVPILSIPENNCVKVSPGLNYSVQCDICPNAHRNVYYAIPNRDFSNAEDCINSGILVIATA